MGLTSTLNNALSGLRVTQAGLNVVSSNVANADSIGYIRRQVSSIELVSGGAVSGARNADVQRMLDRLVQKQLWTETSGAGYTGVRADFLSAVDRLYGAPGSANALDVMFNSFTSSLQQLKGDPSSYAVRSAVLDTAGQLASRLNDLSASVQNLRSQAEGGIDAAVTRVNELLERLQGVNSRLTNPVRDVATAGLEDERDRIVGELSQYVDVRATVDADNRMSVVTTAGLQLFDGSEPVRLTFDARPALAAEAVWTPNPATRGAGTITAVDQTGNPVDVVSGGLFRSGEIAGLLELRDGSLVQMQAQLDEIAAQMSSALSDQQRAGTAVVAGAAAGFEVDLAGLQSGNTVTLNYTLTPSGQQRSFTFARVESAASLPLPAGAAGDVNNPVIGIDFSGGMGSVVTQIQAAIGGGFTASNAGTVLRIVDDGAGATTDVTGLTARPTNMTLTNAGATPPSELPFFVDSGRNNTPYTGSFEGTWQKTGFAGRIAINPGLLADSSRLVVFGTAPQTLAGDVTRPTRMLERLTQTVFRYAPATGIGGTGQAYTGTIAAFTRRVIEAEGQAVESALSLDEGQKIAKVSVESRFAEKSGVNVDQEMSSLIELQTAYAANARIISAVKEMMDLLLRA